MSYDADGFDSQGYDRDGYDREGYGTAGFDRLGYSREGYTYYGRDRDGYDRQGYGYDGFTREGYDFDGYNRDNVHRDGYNADGWDVNGYGRDGYNDDGYDRNGFGRDGRTANGYDERGYDSDGFNEYGRDEDGYDREGYDYDGFDRDGCDSDGNSRYDDEPDSALHDYGYRPTPVFNGDSGPYFGMEIEVTTDEVSDSVATVERHAGSLVYCKADSSVDGMEMVTHPMSYDWAMANFPWDMLTNLSSDYGCSVVPQENGIHVHIGRDGFSSPSHQYRWLKLWYRNPNDIQRIARRSSDNWAAFSPSHRRGHAEHVKRDKPGYNRRNDSTLTRYAAVNTTNKETLEVRVFASSLRPQRVKAALQLVAASVEYTRQLTADDVCKKHGWDWKAFMSWVRRSGLYPDLVAEDRIRR